MNLLMQMSSFCWTWHQSDHLGLVHMVGVKRGCESQDFLLTSLASAWSVMYSNRACFASALIGHLITYTNWWWWWLFGRSLLLHPSIERHQISVEHQHVYSRDYTQKGFLSTALLVAGYFFWLTVFHLSWNTNAYLVHYCLYFSYTVCTFRAFMDFTIGVQVRQWFWPVKNML